jgi:acyl transferase domain-containing protein/NAD(P)-dependent dehydrogenase (short-subunit alcohol dehydrogenase family)/SAM-dependent methyltransferase/acyl carrier protein
VGGGEGEMNDFLDQISALSPRRLALLAVKLKEQLDSARGAPEEPIAVIGIGCRFPGANDPDAFWEMLESGREGIREVPAARWRIDDYFDPDPDAPGKMATRKGGFLDEIDRFDPAFFGIAPREAVMMDPQQRLLLEVTWEAVENAGLAPASLMGSRTGVYVGICNGDYNQLLMGRDPSTFDAYLASGNATSVASGRLSYVLGLQGPCMTLDTSCSASLVAIHAACQSLRLGESSLALAGGANIMCAPETSIALSRGHMLATDGRCKTFDAAADGFARGEGCGMVVLKRLSDAKRDGDRIWAVVRGSAVNQDGKSGGLTVPNGPAQESVIRDALAAARLEGSDIDYVEAHGTGTSLGDPIEVRSLGRVLGPGRDPDRPLLIGSVKTNIGHLESAAGVAGFLKVVLSLRNEAIPRHLNFENPNPFIEWADLPVAVADSSKPWARGARPRRAGVSSFGFSGTNAHIILEEAPPEAASIEGVDRPLHCLTVSARSEASLRDLTHRYAEALAPEKAISLSDVAHVAGTGRAHLKHRVAIVAADAAEARAVLLVSNAGGGDPKIRRGKIASGQSTEVVFLYTGAGAQYPGMGRSLYQTSPVFRDAIDLCDGMLGPDARGRTLKSVLWGSVESEPPIHEIGWTQPAMFAIEYALTTLWRSWGVEPAAVIGHSVGEYTAACAAGVFSLEDGLRLIAERGRLMQSLPPGGMMAALFAPIDDIEAAIAPLRDRVAIAAINAPGGAVISGETAAVETVLAAFARRNVIGQRLFVSLAAHSPLVEPALDRMEALARGVAMSPPSIPIAWNLTGRPLPNGEAPDALYWRRHMRAPVLFADGVKALHDDGFRIFLEVGPHPSLLALARQSLPEDGNLLLTSLRRSKDDWNELLTSFADLHVNGVPVDFAGFDRPYSRRRVTLPTYPFDRERYWAPPLPRPDQRSADVGPTATVEDARAVDGLFYKIAWEPAVGARHSLRAPTELADEAVARFRDLAARHDFAVYDRSRPEIDRLTVDFICKALIELGFDVTPGRRFNARSEASRLGVAQRCTRLFHALMALLARHGILRGEGPEYAVVSVRDSDCATSSTELLSRFSEVGAELEVLRRCGPELSLVLTGERDPLKLLFDDSGFEHLRRLYSESPFSRTFNGTLAGLLRRAAASVGERPLRILEIGAGTGGTTGYLLRAMGLDVDYTFTDISPLFLARAKEQFKDYPRLRMALLDVERSPADQGFETGAYDVVIASNAVHATADIQKSMLHIAQLLAPSGLFFAIEGLAPETWVNITFGLSEGWWRSTDAARRPNGPLLNAAGWRAVLVEVGFDDVAFVPDGGLDDGLPRQAIIIGARTEVRRRWVILADRGDLAPALAAALAASGAAVKIKDTREWRAEVKSAASNESRADWGHDDGAGELGIVYLGALDAEAMAAPESDAVDLDFLKYAATANAGKVWLVTKGAVDVRGIADVTAPDQAALWGLGRTFAREHSSIWGGLLDLDPTGDAYDAVAAVVKTIQANDGEDQNVWRDGVRAVARLIPDSSPEPSRPFSLRPDRAYLISGGLGGIGLQIAAWLANNGARHLVLVGRRPFERSSPHSHDQHPGSATEAVAELEARGVVVETPALDVSDPEGMAGLMARFGEEWPPLGGIIHAAVALTHSPLANMPKDDFLSMMRTKVAGARWLHTLSAAQPVDFFVCFSSGAALLGQIQYAHYAAANAVLDALACGWSARGGKALSVNWGAWQQMWSLRSEDREGVTRAGFRPMKASVALEALGRLLAAGASRAIVADIDRTLLRDVYESRGSRPLLSELSSRRERAVDEERVKAREVIAVDLSSLAPADRLSMIGEKVRFEVVRLLGLSASHSIDPNQSLFELGLDSLMAMELRRRLGLIAGATLPAALAFNYPNLSALITLLDETIGSRVATPGDADEMSELLDRVDDLSGAELDSMLARMLDEEGAS